MDAVVLHPSNEEEMKLLKDFISNSHIKSRFISDEEKEDMVLGLLMQETDYDDVADAEQFIKKLQDK